MLIQTSTGHNQLIVVIVEVVMTPVMVLVVGVVIIAVIEKGKGKTNIYVAMCTRENGAWGV